MLLYGVAGTGKSILASTFPNALILDADNSHRQYQRFFLNNRYVEPKNCLIALEKAVTQLQEKGELVSSDGMKMETIVIDSLTNIENLAIANLKGFNYQNWGKNLYNGRGKMIQKQDWGGISGSTIALLTYLRDLPVNLVVITQIQTTLDNGVRKYAPNLIGKGADEALHFPDFVGYMSSSETQEGKKNYLHLSSSVEDNFIAKSRTVQGAIEPIPSPHYSKIVALLENQKLNLNFN